MPDVGVAPRDAYPGKRVLDVGITLLAAPFWIPIGLVCAALVRFDSAGPVVIRQERVGCRGVLFGAFKFRSMVDDPNGNPLIPDDRSVTRVGRLLRRLSLDELPQLVNVLRGEMSLVGPRPALAFQAEREDERQRRRHSIKPGLTGLAQLNGRNSITWSERIDWDLKYVDKQSVWLDLALLVKTPITVLMGRGVYGHPTDDPFVVNPPL